MSDNKTHWRKHDKTDFLGVADIDEMGKTEINLTISKVEYKQAKVRGKNGFFRIATFIEKVKPMILNAGNAKVIKKMSNNSQYLEDWVNVSVTVYVKEGVKFGHEITEGLRIKPNTKTKTKLSKDTPEYENVVKAIENGYTIEQIKTKYDISKELEAELCKK